MNILASLLFVVVVVAVAVVAGVVVELFLHFVTKPNGDNNHKQK